MMEPERDFTGIVEHCFFFHQGGQNRGLWLCYPVSWGHPSQQHVHVRQRNLLECTVSQCTNVPMYGIAIEEVDYQP